RRTRREGTGMRFFLAATLSLGLIGASYPAGATQTVSPCLKRCGGYTHRIDSRSLGERLSSECWDACRRGEAYPTVETWLRLNRMKLRQSREAQTSADEGVTPAPRERSEAYRRLREMRLRELRQTREAQN